MGGRIGQRCALIEAELRRGPLGLLELTCDARRRSCEPQPSNLLVLVDQFEEIFTYAASGDVSPMSRLRLSICS
jgi:hypothetical protein